MTIFLIVASLFCFLDTAEKFLRHLSKLDKSFWTKVPDQYNVIVCAGKMDAGFVAKK